MQEQSSQFSSTYPQTTSNSTTTISLGLVTEVVPRTKTSSWHHSVQFWTALALFFAGVWILENIDLGLWTPG